jgi:DNA modification methylase
MSEKEETKERPTFTPTTKIVFGDSRHMDEVRDETVGLVLTSPPYFNAPFDYPGLFVHYDEFVKMLEEIGQEIYRVLDKGRMAIFVVSDVRIDGVLYPITADLIKAMQSAGLNYQERIIWKKPEGFIRISRRSGILLQHPYPLYYYPDNVFEDIVIFRKPGELKRRNRDENKIDVLRFQNEKWYMNIWEIPNVSPKNELTKYTSPFPEELAYRLITLYSYVGDIILDPFAGSGTTLVMAKLLGRHSVGYEINLGLEDVLVKRVGSCDVFKRKDARKVYPWPR